MMSPEWAVEFPGCLVEVSDMAVFLKFIQRMRNGDLLTDLQTWSPEAAAQFHLRLAYLYEATHRRQNRLILSGVSANNYHSRNGQVD